MPSLVESKLLDPRRLNEGCIKLGWVTLILHLYIGERMGVNNQHQCTYHGYQNCNFNKVLAFGGYVKVKESLFA